MGNVRMGTDGNYRTSDMYVAAWLLSNGLHIKGIDRHNPQPGAEQPTKEQIETMKRER
jgi:hypothetical protein